MKSGRHRDARPFSPLCDWRELEQAGRCASSAAHATPVRPSVCAAGNCERDARKTRVTSSVRRGRSNCSSALKVH